MTKLFNGFPVAEAHEMAQAYRKLAEQLPKGRNAYEFLSFVAKRLEKGDHFSLTAWHGVIPPMYSVSMNRREKGTKRDREVLSDTERKKYSRLFFGKN